MLVTLVLLLASEPGDQDSIKEAFLECFLKDEKGTVAACPLFIFSARCCLDQNLSCCVKDTHKGKVNHMAMVAGSYTVAVIIHK